jgi:hypothetical protein
LGDKVIRHSIPSSKFLRLGAVVLIAAIAPSAASATVVNSAANIPYSGISHGGVNMATGELILVMRLDLGLAWRGNDSRALKTLAVAETDYNNSSSRHSFGDVVYGRYYASMLAREGLASGHLGTNWLGTYDWSLSVAMPMVTIVANRGQRIQFQQSPGGAWDLVSPTYEKYGLDFVGSMWRLTHPGLAASFSSMAQPSSPRRSLTRMATASP